MRHTIAGAGFLVHDTTGEDGETDSAAAAELSAPDEKRGDIVVVEQWAVVDDANDTELMPELRPVRSTYNHPELPDSQISSSNL